jgi:hypothetical protein
LLAVCLALAAGATAQNGPITSRLASAKFVLMKGWWGSDHDLTTPATFRYIAGLAASRGIAMDTANIAINPSALSQANLAKYDVMMWYNVYRMYHNMDSATRVRVEQWYEGKNRGMSCFHQCVRAADNALLDQGITWTWWHDMMGRPYTSPAGQGSGPVYLDPEGRGTVYGAYAPPGQDSIVITDEWYQYAGAVRGTPGTRMLLTTKRSLFPSGMEWSGPGEDKPIAWIREYRGGRFALNGMYHFDQITTATGALRAFHDSTLIGIMRFLAGYDGCKDSAYREYNAKATHQPAGACRTPTFIHVGRAGFVPDRMRVGEFRIRLGQPGAHILEIFENTGRRMLLRRGEGEREYRFPEIGNPGIYYIRVKTDSMRDPYTRKIVLL